MRLPGSAGLDFTAFRRLFVNRNFAAYSGGKLLADIGEWAQRVTIAWMAWELTHSALWLGVIAFADLSPTVVIGLIAGAYVDRNDYRRLAQAVQVAAVLIAVVLTVLTAADVMTIELLTVLALLRGAAHAFYRPARMVLVYNLVQGRDLAPAIAVSSLIFNGSRFVGPAVGGLLMLAGGTLLSFAVAAVFYVVFLIVLSRLKLPPVPPPATPRRGLIADTAAGLRYAFAAPGISLLLVMVVITAISIRPFTDLLPAFADQVFGQGVGGLTLLLVAHGLGATLGGVWLAGRVGGVSGLTAVTMINLLVIGFAVLGFALMPSLWLALPFLVVAGASLNVQGVAIQVLVQTSVAPAMRGRVLGLYTLLARGCPALGALAMGAVAELLGPPAPVAAGAVLALLLWLAVARRRAAVARVLEQPMPTESLARGVEETGSDGSPR